MANILKTEIKSSLGNLTQTIQSIKNSQTGVSKKEILALEGEVEFPYYLFKDSVDDNYDSIYIALKDVVSKTIKDISKEDRAKTAIIVGTSITDWNVVKAIETTIYDYKKTEYYSHKRSIDSYAKDLSDEFGLSGFTMTINTACTSSANAVLEASNLVDAKLYKYVVVIGLEIFSKIMSSGFCAMQLLSTSAIKPFSNDRDGTILGEAIVSILIGEDDSAWKVRGGFTNCDGVSITAVSEEGDEFVEIMQKALEVSDVKKEDIKVLKTHATGTNSNDISEINAISRFFDKDIKFTALKPYLGHTIGACGALEIAVFMACIDNGFVPKTLNHFNSINSDYTPILEDIECNDGIFMLNYFGFGGNNTSVILEKELV